MSEKTAEQKRLSAPKVHWDDSRMRSSYANVCNVSSTREEITLLLGINQTWNATQKEVTIELTDRVILNPYAAKRLSVLLNNVLEQHEQRFGAIDIGSGTVPDGKIN